MQKRLGEVVALEIGNIQQSPMNKMQQEITRRERVTTKNEKTFMGLLVHDNGVMMDESHSYGTYIQGTIRY